MFGHFHFTHLGGRSNEDGEGVCVCVTCQSMTKMVFGMADVIILDLWTCFCIYQIIIRNISIRPVVVSFYYFCQICELESGDLTNLINAQEIPQLV